VSWPTLVARQAVTGAVLTVAVLGLWCAVLGIPVEWPLNAYRNEHAVFRLGPVSADVLPGQTFGAAEPFDLIAVPVKVGGPLGSAADLRARLRAESPRGAVVAESALTRAVSTAHSFQVIHFPFPESLPAGEQYYVEFDVPRESSWPIYLAATQGDQAPSGELLMQGNPTFAGEDLAYQLLRRQSIRERLPTWWGDSRGAVIVGLALVVLLQLASWAAAAGLPTHVRHWLPHYLVLGLAPPALLAAAYFALFFLVL